MASVGAVLLIACANVANLMLARAARRQREMAVRTALGASRARIARQMLVESFVLSTVSGAIGLSGAYALMRLILAFAPGDLPRADEVHLDIRVVIFTLAIVFLDSVLFGVLPAWRSSKADPQDAMKSDWRTSTGAREGRRIRAFVVGLEVAVATVCLIVGGLLLQSFVRVLNVQRGFDVENIETVDITPPGTRYPNFGPGALRRTVLLRTALERVQALPGIASAGLSSMLPLTGEGAGMPLILDDRPAPPLERPIARIRAVNADFFHTMGIPLKEGRLFRDDDAERSVVVSSATARVLWPAGPAIGRHVRMPSDDGPVFDVVGVVGDAHTASLTSEAPLTVYLPYWQQTIPVPKWSFAFRTTVRSSVRYARAHGRHAT